MKLFNTYEEAVISNRGTSGICKNEITGEFLHLVEELTGMWADWKKCNPADYLETLERFLASGKRLVKGDSLILLTGYVAIIEYDEEEDAYNAKSDMDSERFVLHSAADQVETPEEKEAFDAMTETAPQQLESLGKWIPKSGQTVYIAQINTLAGVKEERYFVLQFWCNSKHQREYLDCGILFPTKEEAEIKTKTMLGIPIETPAEREERERLEAAYYLYCKCGIQHETVSFEKFKADDDCYPCVWLDIVDETGYRKERKQ